MKILSAEQVRQWDQYTIQYEPISSWELMERASAACTRWIIQNNFTGKPIKIFCGKGNNGGDGLAIACQLAEKNIIAQVFILEFGAAGTPDFQQNLNRLHHLPVSIHFIQNASFFPEIEPTDVVIDALFGSGVNRPLQDLSAQLVQYINASEATIISIDLPSGMMTDQSTIPHPVVKASYTLTFQTLKLCFLLAENEVYFGQVQVLPIGLLPEYLDQLETPYEIVDSAMIQQLYLPRKKFSHKGTFGHSLIIAGATGKLGAAILATKACLRSGAGLVSCLLHKEHAEVMHIAVPEAMVAFRNEHTDFAKYNSIGIGPGLGTSDAAKQLLEQVLSHSGKPMVIDADGLNILSEQNEIHIPVNSILTPHPKEFDRLFGSSANDFERLQKAITKSSELKVIIVLKGHRTAIALPNSQVYFNSTGNPGMATAGSGDVLTGIITGLLAQGYTAAHAAILGVYLHGLAGDLAAKALSEEAMIAGDITRYLGEAFKRTRLM